MTLVAKAAALRAELSLSDELSAAATIMAACEMMGIALEPGENLPQLWQTASLQLSAARSMQLRQRHPQGRLRRPPPPRQPPRQPQYRPPCRQRLRARRRVDRRGHLRRRRRRVRLAARRAGR